MAQAMIRTVGGESARARPHPSSLAHPFRRGPGLGRQPSGCGPSPAPPPAPRSRQASERASPGDEMEESRTTASGAPADSSGWRQGTSQASGRKHPGGDWPQSASSRSGCYRSVVGPATVMRRRRTRGQAAGSTAQRQCGEPAARARPARNEGDEMTRAGYGGEVRRLEDSRTRLFQHRLEPVPPLGVLGERRGLRNALGRDLLFAVKRAATNIEVGTSLGDLKRRSRWKRAGAPRPVRALPSVAATSACSRRIGQDSRRLRRLRRPRPWCATIPGSSGKVKSD